MQTLHDKKQKLPKAKSSPAPDWVTSNYQWLDYYGTVAWSSATPPANPVIHHSGQNLTKETITQPLKNRIWKRDGKKETAVAPSIIITLSDKTRNHALLTEPLIQSTNNTTQFSPSLFFRWKKTRKCHFAMQFPSPEKAFPHHRGGSRT